MEVHYSMSMLWIISALALYWPQTLAWFWAGKAKGTTTLCLVARKP